MADHDTGELALLGKKQELKRRFSFWSMVGFATIELVTWEATLSLLSLGFTNGGPAGLVYGFIISWLSSMSVYLVISELVSMAPISAGQYYWVYMLAPERCKAFCSYMIGWLTALAWIATIATEAIYVGTIVQGLMLLVNPHAAATQWQGTLFSWAVIAICIFINVVIPAALPKLSIVVIVFHISGFISIIAVLWACGTRSTASFVFTTSVNQGNWPTQGLSYLVGYLGSAAVFVGADASVHMAEEVDHPSWNVPCAIMLSMFFNGFIGLITLLTLLFNLGDLDSVLESPTGYPFLQVFYNTTQNTAGATFMGAVTTALLCLCTVGISTTASRMAWSFARDRGTPFSSIVRKVEKRTKVPVVAVFVVCVCGALLTLIYVGSYTAFNDVVSLTITGFYGSYFLPASFLLYRRIKGHVKGRSSVPIMDVDIPVIEHPAVGTSLDVPKPSADELGVGVKTETTEGKVMSAGDEAAVLPGVVEIELAWGPFHIPGILGMINNSYACLYMIFVIFWSFWPSETPVSAETMNYSIVVTGGVVLFSLVWYFIHAKKVYKGPTLDGEIAELVRVTRRQSMVVAA